MSAPVEVFTDGACAGNPGPGGWGAVIVRDGGVEEIKGGDAATTNNRMELTAAIRALDRLPSGAVATLWTDSRYLKDGITSWLARWQRNGWKTAAGKPVKNEDLWRALDRQVSRRDVTWRWIKAHAGHGGNERADALAREGMAPFLDRRGGGRG